MNYGPKTITNGLVLYLDAANTKSYPGSGTAWTDLSGNGNTGTLTNGPTFSDGNQGSIVFDGVNDYVINSSTNSIPVGSSSRTIQIWAYPATTTNVFVQIGNSNPRYVFEYIFSAGQYYIFSDGVNTANNISISGTQLPTLNNWNHLVFGNSGQNWFYYKNGIQQSSGTFSVTLNTVGQAYVLANRNDVGGYNMNGRISNVQIYNTALSATEVLQNYNATKSRFGL